MTLSCTNAKLPAGTTFYRSESNSPRGDINGNAVMGVGLYLTPHKEIAEVYGTPSEYRTNRDLNILDRESEVFRSVVGFVDVYGDWRNQQEREQQITDKAIKYGIDGVSTQGADVDGWVVYDQTAVSKTSGSPSMFSFMSKIFKKLFRRAEVLGNDQRFGVSVRIPSYGGKNPPKVLRVSGIHRLQDTTEKSHNRENR